MQEFNKGVYDYIIASDENVGKGEQDTEDEQEEEVEKDEREFSCSYGPSLDTDKVRQSFQPRERHKQTIQKKVMTQNRKSTPVR